MEQLEEALGAQLFIRTKEYIWNETIIISDSLPVTYPAMDLYGREMCCRMGGGNRHV